MILNSKSTTWDSDENVIKNFQREKQNADNQHQWTQQYVGDEISKEQKQKRISKWTKATASANKSRAMETGVQTLVPVFMKHDR
jgi:hypothetical protein